MYFNKIEYIKIKCENCDTTVITPMDSAFRSQRGQISHLQCPCCSLDLSQIAKSAYHRAFEYNKACEYVEEFQCSECSFIESKS